MFEFRPNRESVVIGRLLARRGLEPGVEIQPVLDAAGLIAQAHQPIDCRLTDPVRLAVHAAAHKPPMLRRFLPP